MIFRANLRLRSPDASGRGLILVGQEDRIDVAPAFRAAVIEAANLVNLYAQEIRALTQLLLTAPDTKLTKEQVYE